jgi:hypothetical protein
MWGAGDACMCGVAPMLIAATAHMYVRAGLPQHLRSMVLA